MMRNPLDELFLHTVTKKQVTLYMKIRMKNGGTKDSVASPRYCCYKQQKLQWLLSGELLSTMVGPKVQKCDSTAVAL